MKPRNTLLAALLFVAIALLVHRCESTAPGSATTSVAVLDEDVIGTLSDLRALQRFVEQNPLSPRLADAQRRIEELRVDDAPWERARDAATCDALDYFLQAYPGHVREPEARTLRAAMEPKSVFDLLADGSVELTTRGAGIDQLGVTLRRHTYHELAVTFPVGTFFAAQGDSQNMVATRATTVRLRTDEPVDATVRVACANRSLPVPTGGHTFQIELAPRQAELVRLAPLLESADASTAVSQAAVWIVTDDADYDALGMLVFSNGFGSNWRAVDEAAAVTALKLCADAGIDWTNRAIAKDEFLFMQGLAIERNGVAEWCRAELERRGVGATPLAIALSALDRDDQRWVDAALRVAPVLAKTGGAAEVRALAHSESPRKRQQCAIVLGKLADPAELETLLALAKDTDSSVRAAAVTALKAIDAPQSREALLRALGDEASDVVSNALVALGQANTPDLVDPLLALAGSKQEGWLRSQALRRLVALFAGTPSRAPELRAAFERALGDADENVAAAGVEGLTETHDPAYVQRLAEALEASKGDWFGVSVVRALDRIGGPESRAIRVRCLASPSEEVAMAAFATLSNDLDVTLLPEVMRLLERVEMDYSRERLLQSLGELGTSEAREHLRRFCEHTDPEVRGVALEALSKIANALDRELVLGHFHDADEEVRAAAVRALRSFPDAGNAGVFAKALQDPSDFVAAAALDSLPRPAAPEFVPSFEAALHMSHDHGLRWRLAEALSSIKSPEAARAALRSFAAEKDATLRWALVLGCLNADSSLVPDLEAALAKETDEELARILKEALEKALAPQKPDERR